MRTPKRLIAVVAIAGLAALSACSSSSDGTSSNESAAGTSGTTQETQESTDTSAPESDTSTGTDDGADTDETGSTGSADDSGSSEPADSDAGSADAENADAVAQEHGADYADCDVWGEWGSISIDPVKDGQLTIQTTLPSPGWWKGKTVDGIKGGYEYCLAANIAFRAGLPVAHVDNVSFAALVAGQTKNFDIALAQTSVTPEREKVVDFSSPYFDSNIGVLAPTDSDITADNIASKTLGVQVGTTSVDWVNDNLKPENDVKVFDDTGAMVTAVRSGLVDAALQDTAIMLGFAAHSDGKLSVIGQYTTGEHYAAMYPQGSDNEDVIDGAIDDMRADGTLDKLSAQWLGPALGGDPAAVPMWTVK